MGAVGLTVVVLLLFVGASYSADRAVASSPNVPPIHIHITGHEWWWEVEYTDSVPITPFSPPMKYTSRLAGR